jgi:cytosine/adenosine deaminase-related metal-dependent hydrolase
MQKRQGSILIKDGLIVTMDPARRIFHGNLYIEDGLIREVGSERNAADKVIDARRSIVMPGFIQTHIHLCQVLFRGLADDVDVVDWLKLRIWPLESAHDEASISASARLGIAELIAGGTTTALSMETARYTDSVFSTAEESGFRLFAGNAMMDVVEPGTMMRGLDTQQSFAESKRLYYDWHGKGNGRIRYAIMPRGARNCSPELVALSAQFARDNGLIFHTHISENGPLSQRLKNETGVGDIELLLSQGVANERLVVAHAIWLNDNEIGIVKENRIKIAHCPSANMKLSSGFCKVPEMRALGIDISLGADGAPCNNNLDMLNEMRLAGLIHKPRCGPTAMKAAEVLEMATIGGAKCLGIDNETGSLEAGKKADVILLNRDEPHCSPCAGVPVESQIVYSLTGSDVDTTIIDGVVLYENKRFTQLDIKRVLSDAEEQSQKVLGRVAFGGEMTSKAAYK